MMRTEENEGNFFSICIKKIVFVFPLLIIAVAVGWLFFSVAVNYGPPPARAPGPPFPQLISRGSPRGSFQLEHQPTRDQRRKSSENGVECTFPVDVFPRSTCPLCPPTSPLIFFQIKLDRGVMDGGNGGGVDVSAAFCRFSTRCLVFMKFVNGELELKFYRKCCTKYIRICPPFLCIFQFS